MNNKLLILIIIVLTVVAVIIKPKEVNENNNNNNNEQIIVHLDNKELSINDYLIGVVGCEMPASFNYEAIKAQAIASRTFAYNYLKENTIYITKTAQCYLDNNQLKDKWKENYDKYYKIIEDSIYSTDKEVITYDNKIIKSYYFAISNGKTSNAVSVFNEELPYLSVVDSSFDSNVNKFEVINTYSYENFCNTLKINPCVININNIVRDESNRITSLFINDIQYEGTNIRKLLNLRSTDFDIKLDENAITITTRGYGHGVGMSQYGANYLASIGYTYKDILKYYYKNTEIINL